MIRVQPRKDSGGERCVFCHAQDGELDTCAGCGTRVHLECRREAPRCATLGCLAGQAPPATVARALPGEPAIARVAALVDAYIRARGSLEGVHAHAQQEVRDYDAEVEAVEREVAALHERARQLQGEESARPWWIRAALYVIFGFGGPLLFVSPCLVLGLLAKACS